MLYRYYKESYSVKILDENDEVIQLFDINLEGKIRDAAGHSDDDPKYSSLKKSIYNDKNNKAYLFEAPWVGSLKDAKYRIDLFLYGNTGIINNVEIKYDNGFIKDYGNKTFKESFVEYAYTGETISTANRIRNNNGKYKRKFKNYYNI